MASFFDFLPYPAAMPGLLDGAQPQPPQPVMPSLLDPSIPAMPTAAPQVPAALQSLGSMPSAWSQVQQSDAATRALIDQGRYADATRQGLDNPMLGAFGGNIRGVGAPIRAYHGSPHDFDRFDLSKIGTGEGAQAYGHGLYFAENEGVARGYRDTLAGKAPLRQWGDQPLESSKDWYALQDRLASDDWRLAKIIEGAGKTGSMRAAMDMFEPHTRNASDGPLWAAAMRKFEEGAGQPAKGRMYEVDIHADPQRFLDWDRPLAGQPEAVRQALGIGNIVGAPAHEAVSAAIKEARAAGVPLKDFPPYRALQEQNRRATAASYDALGIRDVPSIPPGDLQASAYHTGLIDRLGDPVGATSYLADRGIPGIRYLDQGSRGAGAGTSNYALFDDSIIEIRRKYGLLPPLAAGGLGLSGGQGEPAPY